MYRLYYWPKRGRAEQIRLLLNELDQPYEDVYVAGDSFRALKDRRPRVVWFGTVPLLEDGDFHLLQGPAILSYLARKHGMAPASLQDASRADAIAWSAEDLRIDYMNLWSGDVAGKQAALVSGHWSERFLPGFDDLLEQTGTGFFVGASLTHADIAVWDILDSMTTWVSGATLDGYPRLAEFFAAIKSRPRIAAYLASDRRVNS
jgi:glutathione S-transferase